MSAKRTGYSRDNQFEIYEADTKYARTEVAGLMDHSGPPLKPIVSKLTSTTWDFNFDHTGFYERLIRESWKSAVVPTGPRSQPGMMGGHRGRANTGPGNMPPLPPAPGQPQMPPLPARPSTEYKKAGHLVKPPMGVSGPPAHLKGMAKDWSLMKTIPRVNAYSFRGDTRDPSAIKAANGFAPPATRTDDHYLKTAIIPNFQHYMKERFNKDVPDDVVWGFLKKSGPKTRDFVQYEIWRAMMDQEKYHLGRMLSNEALKGYTSTSKSINVAKGYAKPGGYVYVLKVTGAFIVPQKNSGHAWTGTFAEEELAMPGPVPWSDIVALRQVGTDKKFTGPIFMRVGFSSGTDKKAAAKILDYMSGKKQAS